MLYGYFIIQYTMYTCYTWSLHDIMAPISRKLLVYKYRNASNDSSTRQRTNNSKIVSVQLSQLNIEHL